MRKYIKNILKRPTERIAKHEGHCNFRQLSAKVFDAPTGIYRYREHRGFELINLDIHQYLAFSRE